MQHSSAIKDIFAEAKSNGVDVPTMKKVLKLRAVDAAERDEANHLLDAYCVALGYSHELQRQRY